MSDYLPQFFPGDTVTAVTSAVVTAGQMLAVSGNNTVAATAGAAVPYGVAAVDDTVGGNAITVFRTGIHLLAASGTINAGDVVIPAAAGAVQAIGSGTNYAQVVGVAQAAASNGKVSVALRIA
ncbi:DUF2190 domain-containing protein [Nocardia sp. NPDC046763]|uniref:DUF2190 domain-containing protein n=1 Tax=Nocardia sp. NPDC046763 TaxID=3155256 RepID=UPI0033CFCA12